MGQSSDHALLSPSGASKWTKCTRSVRLEEQFPDSSGAAAREGTLAHTISEILLHKAYTVPQITDLRKRKAEDKAIDSRLKEVIKLDAEGEQFYGPAMLEYCEQYVSFVMEKLSEAKLHTTGARLFIERKLDLTRYLEEGFGTGDAAIVADTTAVCIDLKYGKGVEVSAINNTQMKIYALGWLEAFGDVFDITTIEMHIFQPRIDNFSSWSISVADLLAWANQELVPKAKLAFAGEGEFVPGDHCQFCRAKAVCKALADYNFEIVTYQFRDPALLDDAEVSDVLTRGPMLVNWANAVKEHAQTQAIGHGKKWPGYKVVEGRSDRVLTDQEKIVEILTGLELTEKEIFNKKLVALGDLEKLLGGPKKFTEILGPYTFKPKGKPTLVPVTDKRNEFVINAGAAAFDDDFDSDKDFL